MATPPPIPRPGVHGRFQARRHNRRMLRDNIKAIGESSKSTLLQHQLMNIREAQHQVRSLLTAPSSPHHTLPSPHPFLLLQLLSPPSNPPLSFESNALLVPTRTDLPTRRLARRGGVKRIKIDIYDKVREVLKSRIEEILRRVTQVIMISGASKGILKPNGEVDESRNGRKTVTTDDIVFVLRQVSYFSIYSFVCVLGRVSFEVAVGKMVLIDVMC